MGKIPQSLRETIARNIRECRMKKYPNRGGSKQCAEAIGVSPQQWSPWERGQRTPDEARLESIAKFFDVSVEFLRRDNRPVPGTPSGSPPASITDPSISNPSPSGTTSQSQTPPVIPPLSVPETIMMLHSMNLKAVYEVEIHIKNVKYIPVE
jgi:Predicted transcriptional regulators